MSINNRKQAHFDREIVEQIVWDLHRRILHPKVEKEIFVHEYWH
jgi:hypothetical protein